MAKRILLADDSITIQKVVELTFSDGDYEVTAVNNGSKAIQKLSEMRPDIILSDIIMPEKNGYEVCEFVKSHPDFRNIPVVLLTGTFEPFDPDRADKAGCDAVVTKPFESQSLIHKVEELIEQARSQAPTGPVEAVTPAEPAPAPDAFATGAVPAHEEVFAPPPEAAPAGGETRAFPAMKFDNMQAAPAPPPPATSEPASPWDEPAPGGGETRAFPTVNFEEMQKAAAPTQEPASPWDEPAPAGETRAFPRMSFDDLSKMAATAPPAAPPPPPAPEPMPWDSAPVAESAAPPAAEPSPLTEPEGGMVGETRAFPRMSFDDLEKMANEAPPIAEPPAAPSFMLEQEAAPAAAPVEPVSFLREPEPETKPQASGGASGDLTDEQIDRIARRVVQLMSEQVVRNIAWEVIPDLAESVVKERIRQLESE